MHILLTTILYAALAWHGLKKNSLSLSGAIGAAAVCFPTFSHPDPLFMAILLAFYLSASKLTKLGTSTKQALEEDFKMGGQRTAIQVFSNGFTGTFIACIHYMLVYHENRNSTHALCFADGSDLWLSKLNTALIAAYIGHYACCNGDTWASELGIFSTSLPRLITTFQPVPKGTNGGISPLGTLASVLGGAVIGLTAALSSLLMTPSCSTAVSAARLVALGAACGFVGSLVDSVLGATLQRSTFNKKSGQITGDFRRPKTSEERKELVVVSGWEVLDNHQVNFVASLVVAVGTGVAAWVWW
ncbi:Transmembrane protein 19 [Podochytrium sp. JEL0797]|nr:Transmembrane protein 19 [Podochytrium sp. JEL0797]